jgi:HEPN domain-containing protein
MSRGDGRLFVGPSSIALWARGGCLSRTEHLEVARVLLEKAEGDLAAVRLLAGDERQSDHVVGFHAQQAVEKAIKAVLVSRELEIPLTHDIGYLVRLCADVATPPEDVAGARWLTPWRATGVRTPRIRLSIALLPCRLHSQLSLGASR